jgi:hypothetical protein
MLGATTMEEGLMREKRDCLVKRFSVVLGISFLTLPFGPQDAFAYVDPGSGSILLQLMLGGVAGVGVVAKLYWQRIRDGVFRILHKS